MYAKSFSLVVIFTLVGSWGWAQETYLFIEQEKSVFEHVVTVDNSQVGTILDYGASYEFSPETKSLRYSMFLSINDNRPFVTPFNVEDVQMILGQRILTKGSHRSTQKWLYAASELPVTWKLIRGTHEHYFGGNPETGRKEDSFTDSFKLLKVEEDDTVHIVFNGEEFALKVGESRVFPPRELDIPINRKKVISLSATIQDTFTNHGRAPRHFLGHQRHPDIFGVQVVFLQNTQGKWDLLLVNLTSGEKTVLSASELLKRNPTIDGRMVIWEGRSPETQEDVYIIDIDTKVIQQLTTDPKSQFGDMSGKVVVWRDADGVYKYDLVTHKMEQLSTEKLSSSYIPRSSLRPKVFGNRVIWLNKEGFMIIHNLTTKSQRRVLVGESAYHVVGAGTNIVIFERKKEQFDLSICDANGNEMAKRSIGLFSQASLADFDGNRIVWEQIEPNGYSAIYLYETVADSVVRLAGGIDYDCRHPAISGDFVVWEDYRHGNPQIHSMNLITKEQKRILDILK